MKNPIVKTDELDAQYQSIFGDVSSIIHEARQTAARSINGVMTATYWMIGQHIVEFEQSGEERAEYGTALIKRLAEDLTQRFGRGFGAVNLNQMKRFYLLWPSERIFQTPSEKLGDAENMPTTLAESSLANIASRFPLSWSAYVRLLSVKNINAREFYETESLRGGWTVRKLGRQINTQFYERTALSKNKAAMLTKGQKVQPEDRVLPEEEIKDPFVLEFLDLKDEYSEKDLEDALIKHLETFLMELGGDFCFMGRQKRLRVGDKWYRVDLLFYHRRLRCLVVIDLKLGEFTHADAGQMNLYCNYAKEHWTHEDENPPVGLILCSQKDEAVARYALEGLSNKVMAAEYRTTLPDEELLAAEIDRTRQKIRVRATSGARTSDNVTVRVENPK